MGGRQAVTTVWIGVGANLGNPLQQCQLAIRQLARMSGMGRLAVSPWYCTEPVGGPEQPWYINAVLEARTTLSPRGLLQRLRGLEKMAGRRRAGANAPRTLDLDLLFWDQRIIRCPGLLVPHPRLQKRRFVLQPLHDLRPGLRHPIYRKTVDTLLQEVDDLSRVGQVAASIPRGTATPPPGPTRGPRGMDVPRNP